MIFFGQTGDVVTKPTKKLEYPKRNKVTTRMDDIEYAKLLEYNQKHNMTLTETMSEAFALYIKSKEAEE